MTWLTVILHLFIGATLAGVGIVAVLVAGYGTLWPLTLSVLAGFLLAFPVSFLIERALRG